MSSRFYRCGFALALFIILTIASLHLAGADSLANTNRQAVPDDVSPSPGFLKRVGDSDNTPRIVAGIAVLPVLLSMLAHLSLFLGLRKLNWTITCASIYFLAISKVIALPLGLLTVLFGVVIADLDVSLVGVASLGVVYAGNFGSWNAAQRLYTLIKWLPNLFKMECWRTDGASRPVAYEARKNKYDQYGGIAVSFRKYVARAKEEDPAALLPWADEVIISLLSAKFANLTDAELNCENHLAVANGHRGRKLRQYLIPSADDLFALSRWRKGWHGLPGQWVREWNRFQEDSSEEAALLAPASPAAASGHAAPSETPPVVLIQYSLRFAVALFECIRRSKLESGSPKQKEILMKVLLKPRSRVVGKDSEGKDSERGNTEVNMDWFFDVVHECFEGDDRVIGILEGPVPV